MTGGDTPSSARSVQANQMILLLALLGRVTANAYESLGVAPDASEQAIRAAYRRNALANHPDKLSPNMSAAGREAAARRMELINEAYEAIGEPEARAKYDRALIGYGATGGARGGYGYRRAPVQARRKLACTLEQMGGFAAAIIDLAAVLGPRYAAGASLPPLRYWLPPGSSAGDVVRVPLGGLGIDLLLELEEAEPRQRPLRALLARQRRFTRHGADLDTTLWLPAWHNARWWRRPARISSICGRRATAVQRRKLVTHGEVVALRGLGMPLRHAGGAEVSPYAMDRGALRVELRLRSVSSSLWRLAGSAAAVALAGTAVRKHAPWRWFRWRKRKLVIRLWTGPSPLNVGKPFRVWGRTQLYTYQWSVG
jgi:curved DNA-binding protein CbpA